MFVYGILACDQFGGIGFNGKLPWPSLKTDMDRFRKLTSHNYVVMGRKTFDSLKAPLPNRLNIVVTRTKGLVQADLENGVVYCSLESLRDLIFLIRNSHEQEEKNMYIIGGKEIYNALSDLIDIMYVTHVVGKYKCDTHISLSALKKQFPNILYDSKLYNSNDQFLYFEARSV